MIRSGKAYEILRHIGSIKEANVQVIEIKDEKQLIREKIVNNLEIAHEREAKFYNLRSQPVSLRHGQLYHAKDIFLVSKAKRAY